MHRSHIAAAASFALLMLGVSACSPQKEDQPPKPKVTASNTDDTRATPAGLAAEPVGNLPKLGAAPKWELKDINGKMVRSDQFAGKVVVVDFWATWCPPCRAEIPGYVELQKKHGDKLVIVGISLDQAGVDVVKGFATKYGINYPIVMGDDAVVAAFGGVEALPTTFLIDRTGKVRDRKEGSLETAEYEKRILAVMKESASG